MITWRNGTVARVRREWAGAAELEVTVEGAAGPVRALAYPALTGHPEPGDRVLLNTTALDLALGTGGYALVVAIPDRLPPDRSGPGHLVKARYTPLQAIVLGADEQDSPHHDVLRDADDIGGMPVVVADLHSALAPVLAGFFQKYRRPGAAVPAPARAAYVMTDGGALPAWFSRACATLREAGWLTGTVTVGQAFGGDLETVTLHTGLLAARHVLGADVAVVAQGPGNLGTGTRWGFSGVAAGEAVNAVAALGGRPVAALRISDADPRERHRGISHHSLTAYGRVALAPADVVVPVLGGEFGARVEREAEPLGHRHTLVRVSTEDLDEALRASPAPLSTMGRGLDADRAYFLACAAAGRHAAALLPSATMNSLPDLLQSHPRKDELMGLPVKLRHLPQRAVTGAFILQSGIAKLSADEETAKQLHGFASGTYPFLAKLKPQDFVRLLAGTEIALGTALLLPFVPTVVAGAGLTAFSGGLLGLYARTPGMRREGTPLPTQQGTALAKDVWMAGIGLGLVLDELTDSD